MKCPHCNTGIHSGFQAIQMITAAGLVWCVHFQGCPECKNAIIRLSGAYAGPPATVRGIPIYTAYPPHACPRPVPDEVPDPYKQDFNESCAVLSISPKASAALSRRNLQAIIHDKAGIKGRDLNAEIQTLIDSGTVPSFISEGLHAVRVIGNFGAHPIKSTSSGEIVDVEDGEAEWNLDVLESLFDFYFVQPAIAAKRKAEINKKLTEAGKPPLP